MKKKSLALNTILYMMKTLASIFFPFITFPYISRILLAEGVGKYNFSNSYISYFMLIAGLGISTYAIREGARIRDNREKFSHFASEIFTINICSTTISFVLLMFSLVAIPALERYKPIIMIMSLTLPLTALGTDWIFNIYEDFAYVAIRSIAFQIISMLLMFVLVKTADDVALYASISVFASVGANILNYKHACKYFKHKLCFSRKIKAHLKPVFILFASAIASQVYINADITMLGLMKGDYATGIYSASTKTYNMIRLLLSAVISIILPRLSYIKETDSEKEYKNRVNSFFNGYMCIVIPACVGLYCISKRIVLLLSGEGFIDAVTSLKILCFALIFSLLGSIIANSVLIINGQEKIILKATCIGALLNIIGNIFFIRWYSYNGAAITTLVSELIVFFIQIFYASKLIKINGALKNIVKISVGIIGIVLWCTFINLFHTNNILNVIFCIIGASIIYLSLMILQKQELICSLMLNVLSKIGRR